MELGQIITNNFKTALEELAQTPMKVSVSYKLTELFEKVAEEQAKYEKLRIGLLKKYGELDKKGNPKTNEQGTEYLLTDRPAFNAEFDQLASIEVELPTIDINDIKDLTLTPKCIAYLKPLIR